jgi:hypothetical protein
MNIFSKLFLKILEFLKNLQGPKKKPVLSPKVSSGSSTRPGDLFIFNYEDGIPRLVLIVAFERGPNGMFVSKKDNLLVCCFKLTGNEELMRVVIKSLYKNTRACSYENIKKNLIKLFGKENCRTYKIHKMRNLKEVHLSPVDFPNESDPYAE